MFHSPADLACETDNLSTLCELISGSEATTDALTNELFTVFAPTDEAFGSVDLELFDDLINCTQAMNSVLAFHTVYGEELMSTDLECQKTIAMANGDDSRTVCSGDKIYQKGSLNSRDKMPEIVVADIEACNGVIHVVDQVMIPKENRIADCDADDDAGGFEGIEPYLDLKRNSGASCKTIGKLETSLCGKAIVSSSFMCVTHFVLCHLTMFILSNRILIFPAEIACDGSDFSTLCDLVVSNDLAETLSEGTWTVFAPTDEAFSAIEEVAEDLDDAQILDVLLFHAIPEQVIAFEDLPCQGLTGMANGAASRTKCDLDDVTGERIKIQKGAGQIDGLAPQISIPNIEACNGMVHVVNNVMIPKL